MTVVEMIEYFDFILDKKDSPYIENSEKQLLLRRAEEKFATQYSNDNLEDDKFGIESIYPLILKDLAINSSAGGVISKQNIDDAINTETSDGKSFISILSISKSDGTPVKIVRYNDYGKFKSNSFKVASASYPQCLMSRDGLNFDPSGVVSYTVSLVKEPRDIVYDEATPANNVDSELPSFTHDYIVAMAIEEAKVSTRDEALALIQSRSSNGIVNSSV